MKMYAWMDVSCVAGLALGLLSGCGGGAAGSGSGSAPAVSGGSSSVPLATSTASSYHFFNDATHLYAVNVLQSSLAPVVVDQLSQVGQFMAQNWSFDQFASQASGGMQWVGADLLYVNNNHFYRVSTSDPVSVQVSSESQAGQVCSNALSSEQDFTLSGMVLSYTLPGADGVCGTSDDVQKSINLGMSASTAPLPHATSFGWDPAVEIKALGGALVMGTNTITLISTSGLSQVIGRYAGTIDSMIVEGAQLIVTTTDASGVSAIYTQPLAAVASTPVLLKSGVLTNTYASMYAPNRVFYELADSYTAGSVALDGTGDVEYTDAIWMGGSTVPVITGTGQYLYTIDHAFLLQNVSSSTPGPGQGSVATGGQIAEVDVTSGQIVKSLGAVPATVQTLRLNSGYTRDDQGVITGMDLPASGSAGWLFVLDTHTGVLTTLPQAMSFMSGWLTF